jgi:hypothetical protein
MRKINTFWNWFQDNNQTIKNILHETPKNQKHISFWINKNLSYYCKEIDFMIVFPKIGNAKSELIITANGNPEYFNQVIDLVDNAPQLKNWKFTAFIQPTERINEIINGLDEPYILKEISLKASDPKFLSLDYDEKTAKYDIIVFLKNYNLYCDTKTLKQAIFIILQNSIAENSQFQNINFVQLAQPNNRKQSQELTNNIEEFIELYELQLYTDGLNNNQKCLLL